MEEAVKFRVILDHDINKLCLPGMPHTVKDLEATIKQTFGISMGISLQRKDQDFDDFVTLSSIDDLKDRDTLKVVFHLSFCLQMLTFLSSQQKIALSPDQCQKITLCLNHQHQVAPSLRNLMTL